MKLIELKNVSLIYNKKDVALNNISFSINEGEIISIIGENGSGKSTLGKLITKLIEPTKGELFFKNKSYSISNEEIRKNFGMIFQNPDNQFIGNTVEDDVAFGLENRCINPKDMPKIIDEKLNLVDMTNYKKYQPNLLSGGQKQRVAIASDLALNLSLLIFDEATSMLDPKGELEVSNIIEKLKKADNKMTLIIITHNMEEVLLTNRVLVLKDQKISYDGTPDNLFKNEELLKTLNINPPFKYELVTKLKKAGFTIDFNDSLKTIRDKLWQSL